MEWLRKYNLLIEEGIAATSFPSDPAGLYDPLNYFLKIGGKRIRPALVLLGSELFYGSAQEAIKTALAIEYFHNFTLIHDDIMDEAPLRRNRPTVHTKWNLSTAILSGDALLIEAYKLLAEEPEKNLYERLQVFNQTAIEVCEGQQLDMEYELRTNLTVDDYIRMIRLKTSVLLGAALKMGAILANASVKDQEQIYLFGVNVGLAFQIQDDLLDLYANPEEFGKQVGGDIISNKKTILYHLAVSKDDKNIKEETTKLFSIQNDQEKIDEAKALFNRLGVREDCQGLMQNYLQQAYTNLDCITGNTLIKSQLKELAEYLIIRKV